MVSFSPMKLEAVPSSSTKTAESIALVASSRVTTGSSSGPCGSQACCEPSWNTSIPGSGRRARFFRCGALGRLADEPTYLQHALGPGVAARERRSVRHGPAVDRFVEVLGREMEVAGGKLLNHPLDLVHARPPARCPPAPPVHDPLCPVRLIGIAQPAKVPLAHPQQLRRLHAAQLPRLMQPNRID